MEQTQGILIVKANGQKEPFNPAKLESSLLRSGAEPDVVAEIVSHVSKELTEGMSTSQIYRHAFFLLSKKQKPVAFRYSLRKAVMDLGPSGFPFEDFIGYILREKGFEVLTDQMVLGACVPHEVDVIAWNENKLIMAEAKFHNQLGIKTDVKTTLYVKARMDDLKDNTFMYGKERKLDDGWLVTNTKFTSTAIHYGECKGLTMVGWNYPKQGNLQDLIVDSGLHPITCLTTLTQSQKKILLTQGIVLCKNLKENPSLLRSIGFNDEKTARTLKEIAIL